MTPPGDAARDRPRGRRPGRSTARDDILGAARELFAQKGFERTTVRGVAQRAGVDPALVHHYFRTKEDLFSAAVELPMDPAAVLAGLPDDPALAGPELVRRVLSIWEHDEVRATLLGLLRGAVTHEGAARALRDVLARSLLPVLTRIAVDDDSRPLRVALVATHIAGLALGRYVVALPPLAEVTVDDIAETVGPVVGHYLRGDHPGGDVLGAG